MNKLCTICACERLISTNHHFKLRLAKAEMSAPNKRFREGKGSGRNKGSKEGKQRIQRPPGLRGKEIGLFYASLNKHKRMEEQKLSYKERPVASVLLSDSNRNKIAQILERTSLDFFLHLCESNIDSSTDTYSHVKDSAFKNTFLSIIRGSIFDKLSKCSKEIVRKSNIDTEYAAEFNAKQNNPKYVAMLHRRKKLPSYNERENLIKLIEGNQVVVISGETGCGKTTQVSQFILDHYIENNKGSVCKVVCTQPRRISAITVAERVAEERAEKLGQSVGYQIRLEKQMPRSTGSICFCTTGVVLKQMELDPSLSAVSHLILDEIHERDVTSDFLITILREVIKTRRDLKVILMSATLNSEAFSKYYDNCPHINIPGFTYPVTEYFLEDILQMTRFRFPELPQGKHKYRQGMQANNSNHGEFSEKILPHVRQLEKKNKYDREVCRQLRNPKSEELDVDLIAQLLMHICEQEKDDGAILVFLPGWSEISKLHNVMSFSNKFPSNKYLIYPLHSQMPTVNQKEIFKRPPCGVRKIVIATNIAETSITIDDVVYVVDCGRIKISNFDVENNCQTLTSEWVSLANANQRKGRAGRVKPGVCFHVYSRARQMVLKEFQEPEIQRVRLDGVILTAKLLQLGDASKFLETVMDPPKPECVHLAINLLKRLIALDANENLTPLGYHLAKMPMNPQMGKMILLGAIFSCINPILSVAVSLDFKDAFQIPLGKEQLADLKRSELADHIPSDHLVLHRAFCFYEMHPNPRQFCWEFFLSSHTMKLLLDMKKDFMGHLLHQNFVVDKNPNNALHNRNSNNLALVKAIVSAGLYPNIATTRCSKKSGIVSGIKSFDQNAISLHPKSVLNKIPRGNAPLLAYWLKINKNIHDASMVHPLPIIFFGDQYEYCQKDRVITIANAVAFKASEDTSKIIQELRDRMNWFFEYKITHPGIIDWEERSEHISILRAIMELISNEETGDIFESEEDEDDF